MESLRVPALVLALFLYGCGGGGSSGSDGFAPVPPPSSPPPTQDDPPPDPPAGGDDGDDAVDPPEPVQVVAQKGFVVGAEVSTPDGQVIGVTSGEPGSLGSLRSESLLGVETPVVLTVRGIAGSIDTLDRTLDEDDPSFEGRGLRVVYDGGDRVFANPLSTVVADYHERHAQAGSDVASSRAAVADFFGLDARTIQRDMFDPQAAGARVVHERIYLLSTLLSLVALEEQAVYAALADRVPAPAEGQADDALRVADGPVTVSASGLRDTALRDLLRDLAGLASDGRPIADAASTLAAGIEAALPSLVAGRLSDRQFADVQRVALDRVDTLLSAGEPITAADLLALIDALIAARLDEAPVADAGQDVPNAKPGIAVALDGRASEGTDLSYRWSTPDKATIEDAETATPRFVADAPGRYEVSLLVDDGQRVDEDRLIVTVAENTPPRADAGPGAAIAAGVEIPLDGRGSRDADGDALTFEWRVESAPDGATPRLDDTDGPVARFSASTEGNYELRLTVGDGLATDTDTVGLSVDLDGDGLFAGEDLDRDGDRVPDSEDPFPDDPTEFADSDGDGTGNLAQVDEDGDGASDVRDELPFDPSASRYPEFAEIEFNDNPTQATRTDSAVPFRLLGTISQDIDGDYFRFSGTAGQVITARLSRTSQTFSPSVTIADGTGNVLPSVAVDTTGLPLTAGVTAVLPGSGDFFVIVNDFDSRGDPSFTYEVDVFEDIDLDGLADDRELALGIDSRRADTEDDGIADLIETQGLDGRLLALPDLDGDDLPEWWDRDSDGDGVPDAVDGPSDPDNDGLPAFLDTDSDGNGIADREEAGTVPERPVDTDRDGIVDIVDTDDDGDGVLDERDSDRLVRIVPSNALDLDDRVFVDRVRGVDSDGRETPGAARPGDEVVVVGDGFLAGAGDPLIVLVGDDMPLNLEPDSVADDRVTFTAPEGSTYEVAVVSDGRISNAVVIEILSGGIPRLVALSGGAVERGAELTIEGENLDDSPTVSIGGTAASVLSSTPTELRTTVPADAASGAVRVVTSTGTSNPLPLRVFRTIPAAPGGDLPELGGYASVSISSTFDDEIALDAGSGAPVGVRVANGEPELVALFGEDDDGDTVDLLAQALVLPTTTEITFDAASTALALVFQALQLGPTLDDAELAAVESLISGLPETAALAAAIRTGQQGDPGFLTRGDGPFFSASVDAAMAAQKALDAAGLGASTSLFSRLDLDPTFDPQEQFDVGLFRVGDTGDIGVENDTQLFMSTRIADAENGRELLPHIRGYFDPDMVGPQGLGLLFFASTIEYDEPDYRDAHVTVITPGAGRPRASNLTVQQYLALRTVVERIFVPLVQQAIGDAIDGTALTKILVAHAPGAVNTFAALVANGDARSAVDALATQLLDDFRSAPPGPVTRAIAAAVGKRALANISAKLAAKLIPGVGQIKAVLEIVDLANTVTNVGKTLADLVTVPGELTFTVDWPLEITGLQPASASPVDRPLTIQVLGQGFAPITRGLLFTSTLRPVVTVDDPAAGSITLDPTAIDAEGTSLTAELPASFRRRIEGPITVSVSLDQATTTSTPLVIEVTTDLQIDGIEPERGTAGDIVVISGTGFDADPAANAVTFSGHGGRVAASLLSASEDELRVVAPAGVETGPVRVAVGNRTSNDVEFEVPENVVSIDFGDNGSLNDDTFALFVDGQLVHSMPSPTRSAGPFDLDLSLGRHVVVLRGITAPDQVGTYFISIANAVVVSGDPLSGGDLTAGVEKRFVIEVTNTARSTATETAAPRIIWPERDGR